MNTGVHFFVQNRGCCDRRAHIHSDALTMCVHTGLASHGQHLRLWRRATLGLLVAILPTSTRKTGMSGNWRSIGTYGYGPST